METVYNAGNEKALLPVLKYSEIILTFFIRDDGNRLLIYMIDENASGDGKNFPAYLTFLYFAGNRIPLRKLELPMVFVAVWVVRGCHLHLDPLADE